MKKKTVAPAAPAPAPAAPAPTQAPEPVSRSENKGSGTAVKSSVVKAAAAMAATKPSHQEIATRAFEIYAARGYAAGDQAADWAEAERQLTALLSR